MYVVLLIYKPMDQEDYKDKNQTFYLFLHIQFNTLPICIIFNYTISVHKEQKYSILH